MTDSKPPLAESEPFWRQNLEALREVDPEWADRLAAVSLPPAEPATGRDGSPTFRVRTSEGDRWLGWTSMPTVSGPALLENFDPGGSNVVLFGIGQGVEARLLTNRLGPSRAVFVLERDAATLSMALRVTDLADAIRRGRLVLIVGDDLGEGLVRFLAEREGYLTPERMLAWPWMDQAAKDAARIVIQRAANEVARHRTARLATTIETMSSWSPSRGAMPDHPRTMVICPHADQEICRLAAGAVKGLEGLGWPSASWVANTPDRARAVGVARLIAEFRPDLVILIDAVRARLGQLLPDGLPVATWLTPWARLTSEVARGIGPHDGIFTTTSTAVVKQPLEDGAVDPNRAAWLPPAIADLPAADERSREWDVAAIGDAYSLDAESNGLKLDSHQALWGAARRLIEAQAERYTSGDVERLLAQAESQSGASFADSGMRGEFREHINAVLGRTLIRRAAYDALRKAGLSIGLWGRGWAEHASLADCCQGTVWQGDRSRVHSRAKVVLHVDIAGDVTPELLDAAACGAVLVVRAHPNDQKPGGLAQVLEPGREVLTFSRHSELIGHVKRLLADEAERRAIADRARARIAENHTMAHRLRAIRAAVSQTLNPRP
ncbi:MAG: glycosyltransferase family 1 protein [Phycisphaerae bacterium]|nr:glycosyltransferase family 1 protein [Phycisphaerae bacterium]